MTLERRSATLDGLDGTRLRGHAVIFDTRSHDLGGFYEVVRPSAVARALSGDVVGLFNHDPGLVLGRTPKTLQLRQDARGLAFTLDPAPTQAGREVLELVRRGDLSGASIGFRTVTDSWYQDGPDTIRELIDIEITEVSMVVFPAYQQTNVEVAHRSLQAWQATAGGATARGSRLDILRRRHRLVGLR
jgi:HK97 family phage prohead protease